MRIYLFFICLFSSIFSAIPQQLAFPGAEGFGKYAEGGRYGKVYRVTNLNDNGPGSLRDAVSQPNRIIIFDVAGVIQLQSRLHFSKNLTIAGQTAPGDGIIVYGDCVSFSGADNTICRYMRFRMGIGGEDGKDAITVAYGKNMIFDHISTSWGLDENFSISGSKNGPAPENITIQNSIIAQGLMNHSCGGLIQTPGGVTLYRNLYIDNKTRNPKVKGLNQFVNNVVYNWGGGGAYILGDSGAPSWATIVNNFLIKGPDSGSAMPYTRANKNFQLYAAGNFYDDNLDGILNGNENQKSDYGDVFWVENPAYWESSIPSIPKMHPEIQHVMTAHEAYQWIIEYSGAILPKRDAVDNYVIDELKSLGKKGKLIYNENELGIPGIVGNIQPAEKLTDTDNDGIPDIWEEKLGTNPHVDDSMEIHSSGYTNIERYINALAEIENQ